MNFNLIKIFAISLAAVGLIGCTISTPVVKSGGFESLSNTDPSKGEIFVYRDKNFAGAANQYDVMVNGVIAGSLPNGSFFNVAADPGENKVEPKTFTNYNFGKGSVISVEKGKPYCLKLTLNFCMQCKSADINVVDTIQCENEIKSLNKVELK